jgi:26S proteasome regulatory subunit N3
MIHNVLMGYQPSSRLGVLQGIELSNQTIGMVQELNRRSLDQLAAKVYFYYARFYEVAGRLAEIRPTLLNAQRTATLRRDDDTQSTLINLLLRNYFHYNLYDQADKLVSKTTFPENATNNQLARYMYYLGRIKAIQLEYTESHQCVLQAVRKAPQNNVTAGFQQEVHLKCVYMSHFYDHERLDILFNNSINSTVSYRPTSC